MRQEIINHFKKHDPVIFKLYEKYGDVLPHKAENLFTDLCETIVGQQLSVKAAKTIYARFEKLFRGEITPEKILKKDKEKIRSCGISYSKIGFIKDLSQKVLNGEIVFTHLEKLSDDEVIKYLVKVKGIGPWTAEMFLMFSLGRENVFSQGDLGLKNAIRKNYKDVIPERSRKAGEYPESRLGSDWIPHQVRDDGREVRDDNKLKKIIQKWEPYRTYACLLLWKSLNNLPT